MTRVKYTNKDGFHITQKMIAIDSVVEVVLIPQFNSWDAHFFKNENTNPFYTLEDENITSLKKKVKKELINLGVNFSDEVRPNLKKKLK